MPLAPVRARCRTAGGLHRAAHQSLDTVSSAQRAPLSRGVPNRSELAIMCNGAALAARLPNRETVRDAARRPIVRRAATLTSRQSRQSRRSRRSRRSRLVPWWRADLGDIIFPTFLIRQVPSWPPKKSAASDAAVPEAFARAFAAKAAPPPKPPPSTGRCSRI